jgi:cellulose synthase/poly-beta-1,6-N-acetylglucosamine synthase-like glycosyltransferase
LSPFQDARVGAVCGHRIQVKEGAAPEGQRAYADWDVKIKRLESARGSLTSNEGKLHALRRDLACAVPDGVTDDLFLGLEVVRRGFRLCYAPRAVACVPAPVRSLGHEWSRRRRIVGRSLRGIWRHRELLNPFRHGEYAFRLFINKVLRRLLGLHLILAGLGGGWLLILLSAGKPGLGLPLALAMLGALVFLLARRRTREKLLYALFGIIASLAGVADACIGRGVLKWEPRKGP